MAMAASNLSPESASRPPSPQRLPISVTPTAWSTRRNDKKDRGFSFTPISPNPGSDPTRPLESFSKPSRSDTETSLDASATALKEGKDPVFVQTSAHIFQRKHGGWYARLPDVDIGKQESEVLVNGAANGVQATRVGGPGQGTHYSGHTEKEDSSSVMRLLLAWDNVRKGNKSKLSLFDVAGSASSQGDPDTIRRIYWKHDVHSNLKISKLLGMVQQAKADQVTEGEYGLVERLTTRLARVLEREFVGGRYLVPESLRYDNQDVSKYTIDKTCIFFCFPYICLDKKERRFHHDKGDDRHPARTLLQSYYRLTKTITRDKNQCLTCLEPQKLKSCVDKDETGTLVGKKGKELLFVPQFWGLIVGLDTLITLGIADNEVLRGRDIEVETRRQTDSDICLLLVRILFYHKGEPEELIFPIDQCNSRFGILNKKQQILDFLNEDITPESKREVPDDYYLMLDDRSSRIEPEDWGSILQSHRDREMLSIQMRREAPPIEVTGTSEPVSHLASEAVSQRSPRPRPDMQLPTRAFLTWKMQDEFGNEVQAPEAERIARFLRAIHLKLPVKLPESLRMTPFEQRKRPQDVTERRARQAEEIEFAEKTFEEVRNQSMVQSPSLGNEIQFFEEDEDIVVLLRRCRQLLQMFLPEDNVDGNPGRERSSATVRVYWGAIWEFLQLARSANFRQGVPNDDHDMVPCLTNMVNELLEEALDIHEGVKCLRPKIDPETPSQPRDNDMADGVVLLAAIVDSLGSIFHMFIEAARSSNSQARARSIDSSSSDVNHYKEEARSSLRKARSQLIVEAEGNDKENTIGPVLTPEAISIAIMNRLVSGVYRSGPVDVVDMYEECLEYLSSRVKHEASRRLLAKINGFSEEVKIIINVMKQQYEVLTHFRENLDPKSFHPPSIARKMRYKYECRGIDKLLSKINDNKSSFLELQSRADQLSIENVRLVETLQDDNSKAIFVFTLVTILFLPLTFVAGFFGMNLKGIDGSDRDYWHFWKIGGPMTIVIFFLCAFVKIKGEDTADAAGRAWRHLGETLKTVYSVNPIES